VVVARVNPVIQPLQASGIEVTALHSHLPQEQLRLLFMRFRANHDAMKLGAWTADNTGSHGSQYGGGALGIIVL
jgi:hypothetical protein